MYECDIDDFCPHGAVDIDDPNYDGPLVEAESCHGCNSDDMNWDPEISGYVCGDCGRTQF